MKISKFTQGLLHATGVFIYVIGIASLMQNGEALFKDVPNFFVGAFILFLFIFSASATSLLVLGRPIHLYASGHKKESFTLLGMTLLWMFMIIISIISTAIYI